jgi:hypothetical protein
MPSRRKTHDRPAEYIELKARCPDTGDFKDVKIGTSLVEHYLKHDPIRSYELQQRIVTQVLLNPAAIFEGVRVYEEGGFCYAGVPSHAVTKKGERRPPYPGKVFCVYVSPHSCVYLWGWDISDPDQSDYPEKHSGRYGKRIWPH